MRIVGHTGGISSGKSTVSNLFKAHDIPVVDADLVARDILKKGTGGCKMVVSAFRQGILQPDGEVDRPELGQIVFSNPEMRQTGQDGQMDQACYVWVDPKTQLQRLVLRDKISENDARKRINGQVSLDLKRTMADIVIDNSGSQDDLELYLWRC